jgi:hypothetical protein
MTKNLGKKITKKGTKITKIREQILKNISEQKIQEQKFQKSGNKSTKNLEQKSGNKS